MDLVAEGQTAPLIQSRNKCRNCQHRTCRRDRNNMSTYANICQHIVPTTSCAITYTIEVKSLETLMQMPLLGTSSPASGVLRNQRPTSHKKTAEDLLHISLLFQLLLLSLLLLLLRLLLCCWSCKLWVRSAFLPLFSSFTSRSVLLLLFLVFLLLFLVLFLHSPSSFSPSSFSSSSSSSSPSSVLFSCSCW